jgi:hypothetical protein
VIDLRKHVLELQQLESAAAEKAGLRCRLLDEAALMGKDGKAYARAFVDLILADIQPELEASARMGLELGTAMVKE